MGVPLLLMERWECCGRTASIGEGERERQNAKKEAPVARTGALEASKGGVEAMEFGY
jgi:hypothetical protein